ncbi:unnamed protein product, partial [Brenthis ino]
MDLTTRRCEDGGELVNGGECIRDIRDVNGQSSDVTGVIEVSRKTSSFSIRNLVGGGDDRPADGNANPSEEEDRERS